MMTGHRKSVLEHDDWTLKVGAGIISMMTGYTQRVLE
jgi:hypothetical protein